MVRAEDGTASISAPSCASVSVALGTCVLCAEVACVQLCPYVDTLVRLMYNVAGCREPEPEHQK